MRLRRAAVQLGKAEALEVTESSALPEELTMVEEVEVDYPEEGCQDHCKELLLLELVVIVYIYSSNP